MKSHKLTIYAIAFATALALGMQGTFAYAPHTTHAGLTQEMIAFYEALRGERFSEAERELIIQASIDEDNPSERALNHFFDPVHGRGINDYRTAYRWATDELSGNDFTWGAGIDAWARGDRRGALIALGHVLHLIEDSAAPDHTRNDPHMGHGASGLWTGTSPLEDWADRAQTRSTLAGYGAALAKKDPWSDPYAFALLCYDLKECFDRIALYSNQNFYSEDTIAHPDYTRPKVVAGDDFYAFINDEITGKYEKAYLFDKRNGEPRISLTDDRDFSVLSSYFDRLAPQAIATGARVIDLFLTQAESAKQIREEQRRKEQEQSVSAQLRIHQKLAGAGLWRQFTFGFSELFIKTPKSFAGQLAEVTARSAQKGLRAYTIAFVEAADSGALAAESIRRGTPYAAQMVRETYVKKSAEGQALATAGVGHVIVGAEGSAAELRALARTLTRALETLEGIRLAEASAGPHGEVLGARTENVSGQEAAAHSQSATQQWTTNAPQGSGGLGGADNPSPVIMLGIAAGSLPLPELSPAPAPAEEEDRTDDTAPEEASDTAAPPSPEIVSVNGILLADCDCQIPTLAAASAAIAGRAEASTTVALSWRDGAAEYVLLFATGADGNWHYDIALPEGTTTLEATATDAAGNVSEPATLTLAVDLPDPKAPHERAPGPRDLVINELAPRGTLSDPDDEWIELHNTTNEALALDGVALCIDAGVPRQDADEFCGAARVALAGVLPPRGYYLIARERADAAPALIDPAPDLVAPFTIPDGGAAITLVLDGQNGAAIDRLPYCAGWCGKAADGAAIERWRSDRSTEDYAGNWGAPLPALARGLDRTQGPVLGTPGARNSLNYLLALSDTIASDLVLLNEPGGYLVNGNRVTLAAGNTLTIAPGVTIKFRPGQTLFLGRSLLAFSGPLIARGTAEEPIIFTTTADDRAGGDLLGDGTPEDYETLERAGGLDFFDGSEGTALAHVEFRLLRTGPYFDRTSATMTSVAIVDSLDGLELSRSALDATDLLIRNIDGGDAIHAYNASTLTLASTTIMDTGTWGDALDIFRSTLVASDLAASDIGGKIVLNGATTSFDGLALADIRGMPDIAITGGTTTIARASLAGGGAYPPGSDNGIAVFQRASVTVASATIADYGGAGIVAFSGAHVAVASSTLEENGIGLSVFAGATGEIHDSAIIGNGTGVQNADPAAEVDATENYWGYSDGPGMGDTAGRVEVYPYYVANPVGAEALPALAGEPMLM